MPDQDASKNATAPADQGQQAPAPSVLGAAAPAVKPADSTTSATPSASAPATATAPATDKAIAPAAATPAVAAGEIKLAVPKDAPLTEDDAKSVAEFAKANGLTQAQAEKVLEREAKQAGDRVALTKTQQEALTKQQFAQGEKVKVDGAKLFAEDPDFGGAKHKQSVEDATRTVAKFADPELQKFLATHPLGSDPLVLRMFARIGSNLREDGSGSASSGGNNSTNSPAMLDRWYKPVVTGAA